MRRVYQTTFGEGGNCTAACLASILDLPLEAVPDAGPFWAEGDHQGGWLLIDRFLEQLGIELVQEGAEEIRERRPPGLWIATTDQGPWTHATVWHHTRFLHDPDPNGHGDGSDLGPLAIANYLIVLDPARFGALDVLRRAYA